MTKPIRVDDVFILSQRFELPQYRGQPATVKRIEGDIITLEVDGKEVDCTGQDNLGRRLPQWQWPEEQPERYDDLDPETKARLQEWLTWAFYPTKTEWKGHTSYGLKHEFEGCTGIYVTNGQFKGALLVAGYEPVTRETLNWSYRMRFTKPAKKWQKDRLWNRTSREEWHVGYGVE